MPLNKITFTEKTPPVTTLDRLVAIYLVLPNLMYLLGWLNPVYGVPAALLTVVFITALLWKQQLETKPIKHTYFFLAMILSALWIYVSGIGHFTYCNTDWYTRDAVLADLTNQNWPVTYHSEISGQELLLRAPIGYYLPAAMTGKIFGPMSALWALVAWSFVGVLLVLSLLLRGVQNVRSAIIRMVVFILFSGMDIVFFLRHGSLPLPGEQLEWWGGYFSYWSNSSALFWVPNHAIAGWIVTVWLIENMRGKLNVPLAIFLLFCVPLFSPLTAVGLVPLLGTAIITGGQLDTGPSRERILQAFDPRIIATGLSFAVLIYCYLILSSGSVPMRWSFDGKPLWKWAIYYVTFVVMDFMALNILLMKRFPQDKILWSILIFLLLLPLTNVGPYSDLVMRGSLPALAYLAVRLGEWLSEDREVDEIRYADKLDDSRTLSLRSKHRQKVLAMIMFFIGCVTPFQEISRAFLEPIRPYDPTFTLIFIAGEDVPHYLCPRNTPWAEHFLPPTNP